MLRRDFVRTMLSAAGVLTYDLKQPRLYAVKAGDKRTTAPNLQVKRVLAMFKCHFDAGFIDTQAHVVHKYFAQYFPEAIRVAQQVRQGDKRRYVWTTGSWLLYEYLAQASDADRTRMERAIAEGDIAWHALPFNFQTELLDSSLLAGSLSLSEALDRRFGRTTTGAKMTDVPGHTRGLITPLATHGVTFLDIGVNAASRPAELPPIFQWRESSGASITVMYHSGYGAVTPVPGSDLAIAIIVRNDNSGPHTPEEIATLHADLAQQFPRAEIVATDLTAIANAVKPYSDHLPVVTQEMGDTWIYGIASDPVKVARYREVCRLRRRWIDGGKFQLGDATDINLMRDLLLEAEHTWGTDTKTWLDFDHYKPVDLEKMLHTPNYEVVQYSWVEKRRDLFDGVATLPTALRQEAEQSIAALAVATPILAGVQTHEPQDEIETNHFVLRFSPETGAIERLYQKSSGREWATSENVLGLFVYQTLSQKDYDQFFHNYIISKASWAPKDFGKPNMVSCSPQSKSWYPSLRNIGRKQSAEGDRVLLQLGIADSQALESGRAAFPQRIYVELFLPAAEPSIHVTTYWFDKQATRLPEAIWLGFNPVVKDPSGWMLTKSGQQVSPFDVVPCGSRHMHSIDDKVFYKDSEGGVTIEPVDAPLVALGERSPLNFSREQPSLRSGIHCNLLNNAWGTNYIQWFGENVRCRFILRFHAKNLEAS